MSATLDLAKQLIALPSITPKDHGCQDIISERLKALGFHIEFMYFGDVTNLWARKGTQAPLLVFAGHTDVVPPGDSSLWDSDPFLPVEKDDLLYGRGATDMKGGLAAMVVAVEEFLFAYPNFQGSIGFLITSDEEGPGIQGTKMVVDKLINRNETIDYCIIGEASSNAIVGDQIRVGRRGSLHGKLTIHGIQGHIAYPERVKNPIHLALTTLEALTQIEWDQGNEFFPPTTLQISNIHAGTGATNVVPATLEVLFNLRYSSAITVQAIQDKIVKLLENNDLTFDLQWDLSGQPFVTPKGKLLETTKKVINELIGIEPICSTGGGTSDGRFIAKMGTEILELGPCAESAHKVNEHVRISDLNKLTMLYFKILEALFFES